jgi:hypothetical protein
MSPFFQCLNNNIELLVIRGVFHFHFIQLPAEVCYRPIFLAQDCPYCKSACITFYLKCLHKIQQHQNWLFRNFLLQQIEDFISLFYPVKRLVSLLHFVHHRCTNSTKILDELPVETSQSVKTSHLKYTLQ